MNARSLLPLFSLTAGVFSVSLIVACGSSEDVGAADGALEVPAPSASASGPTTGPTTADAGAKSSSVSNQQCVPDPASAETGDDDDTDIPIGTPSNGEPDNSGGAPNNVDMGTEGDEPESACLKCCDGQNPAGITILKAWSKCLEGCKDDDEKCFKGCDDTEVASCKTANGACEKLQACEDICFPEDKSATSAENANH